MQLALGKVVDCLAAASDQKVIVVGHSMGGLIARYAATNPDRSASISSIITMGTPNSGSLAALLGAAALDAGSTLYKPIAVIRLLLSACGNVTTATMEPGGLCSAIPAPVAAFQGDAGRALRAGSTELAALKKTPSSIYLDAVAGGTTFSVPKMGWFTLPWDTTEVPVGDMIVTRDSAIAGAKDSKVLACSYQLSAARGVTDWLGVRVGMTAANDSANQPLGAFTGPCLHTSLMRSIELSNEVIGAVDDDINPSLTDAQALNATIPAGVCGNPGDPVGWDQTLPIKLTNGTGAARNSDGSFADSSVISTAVLGRADVNGDGQPELVLRLDCSGSEPSSCCAGRTSIMPFVAAFSVGRGAALIQVGDTITGGTSRPGDSSGPAQRQISKAKLQGATVVTTEYIAYYEQYIPAQVGGDPAAPVTVKYALKGGKWTPS